MPDSTLPPGGPILRDTNRRSSPLGFGAPRRTMPGEAPPPPAGSVRPRRATHGPVARAERVGPRWRDIQWVDFTSDPDSGGPAAPEPAPPPAVPPAPEQPPLPGLGGTLRHFTEAQNGRLAGKADAIPGLAPRFSRVPLKLAPAARPPASLPISPPGIAQLSAMPPTGSFVVHPRLPITPGRPREMSAAAPPLPLPRPAPLADDRGAFPASIYTSASAEPAPSEPSPSLGAALTARLGRAGTVLRDTSGIATAVLRDKSGAAAAALSGGLGRARPILASGLASGLERARAALQTRVPRNPLAGLARLRPRAAPAEPIAGFDAAPPPLAEVQQPLPEAQQPLPEAQQPPPEAQQFTAEAPQPELAEPASPPRLAVLEFAAAALHDRLAGAVDGVARRVAGLEPRLRLSGMLILTALAVAIGAYLCGALIAGLAGTGGDAKKPAVSSPIGNGVPAPVAVAVPPPAVAPKAPPPVVPPNTLPNDPAARAAFYLTRAKAGNPAAQYDVGVLYARGDGLVQDYASAASWFHAAAAQGNVTAQYNLGVLYEHGLGVTANDGEALNWYRAAADQNNPAAQFNLALAYAEGRGVARDFAAASRWYQRAAERGVIPAMVNLAVLYDRGEGVDRSLIEAYAWYGAAGERGDTAAKDRANELYRSFGDRDKARAEGLAATIGAALDAKTPKTPPA